MSVRLLFDENLGPTLVRELSDIFPQSAPVRDLRLQSAPDEAIWQRAAADHFIIVRKTTIFGSGVSFTAFHRRSSGCTLAMVDAK